MESYEEELLNKVEENEHAYTETEMTKLIDKQLKKYKLNYKCYVVDNETHVLFDLQDGLPFYASTDITAVYDYIEMLRIVKDKK